MTSGEISTMGTLDKATGSSEIVRSAGATISIGATASIDAATGAVFVTTGFGSVGVGGGVGSKRRTLCGSSSGARCTRMSGVFQTMGTGTGFCFSSLSLDNFGSPNRSDLCRVTTFSPALVVGVVDVRCIFGRFASPLDDFGCFVGAFAFAVERLRTGGIRGRMCGSAFDDGTERGRGGRGGRACEGGGPGGPRRSAG